MLNSNLSKPVQLNKKNISGSINQIKKGPSFDEYSKQNIQPKRRPSNDTKIESILKQESNIIDLEKSNLATRPEPISKALLEEARARRAIKSATKQATSSPKSKAVKPSPQKKAAKSKPVSEITEKVSEPVKKHSIKKESTSTENTKENDEKLQSLFLEIVELKKQNKDYQSEIDILKTKNDTNLKRIRDLERQKEEQYQDRRNLELKKELLDSGHQRNINKIQRLLKGYRRDLEFVNNKDSNIYEFKRNSEKSRGSSYSRKKKENDMSIIDLLLCDKNYDKSMLDQLIMIEESNENIWGLSARDLNELNAVLNIYNSNGMDASDIKNQLCKLSWFLDVSSQRNSSIPRIASALDKISSNKLDFREFLSHLLVPLFSSSHYNYLDQLFDLFDMDSDSLISLDDLKGVIKEIEWEDALSVNDLRYLLKQMSTNIYNKNIDLESTQNILVSKEEFKEFFRSIFD
ncbi:EF hand family protein [Cryptosporidium felis]|nr:EF hand family protein [Cryptosporidium felis]